MLLILQYGSEVGGGRTKETLNLSDNEKQSFEH